MNTIQQKEYKDVERILKIVSKWDTNETIETEKDSLWASINGACLLIQQELNSTEDK